MLTIYKYQISERSVFQLPLPEKHTILKVDLQNNIPYMWVMHRTTDVSFPTKFRVAGTGYELNDSFEGQHIATWQQGQFVWHLFRG